MKVIMHKNVLLGAHMSIANGLDKAIRDGESIGCTAIQIFTHSNRQWHMRPLPEKSIQDFKNTWANSTIKEVVIHASYLINIGSADSDTYIKSLKTLKEELVRCEELGISFLVLHPGSAGKNDIHECISRIAESLDAILNEVPGNSMILLENSAGQGSAVGFSFEQLATIRAQVHAKKRIGYCLDTCHAFAAGYAMQTKHDLEKTLQELDTTLGLTHLKAIHLNDSKKKQGSRVDRHEDIGKGLIGLESFSFFMNDSRLENIPKILETPNDTLDGYKKNIDILRGLVQKK